MEETYEKSIFDEETSVVYGGFWERFGALFLDGLILAPLTIANYYNQSHWKSIPLLIVFNLAVIVYKPLLEFMYSATPGKKALSLTVVNEDYGKLNWQQAVLRNILGIVMSLAGIVISIFTLHNAFYSQTDTITNYNNMEGGMMVTGLYGFIVFFVYLADAICLVANNKKQSLHDLIAKTYVIRK